MSRILMRIKEHKEITGATLFIFSTFLQRGLSLITTPIYTRLLSSFDYGIVSTYNTWYGVLSVIFTLSIAANAFNTGLVKFKNNRNAFVSNMISLTGCLVFIGFCGITLLKNSVESMSGLAYKFFVIMFINMFCDVVYGFWGLCSKFDGKYVKVVVANLSISVISIIVTIFVIVNFEGDTAFSKIVAASVVSCVFAIFLAINYVRKAPKVFFNNYWKYALSFCIPLVPHYMSNHLLNQSDRIMITSICGADKTGIYSIAYKMPEIMNICWTCVSTVYIPWLYKRLDRDEHKEIRKLNTIIMAGISLITFSVILLGPEIMRILAAEEYQEGKYIVPILVTGYYGLFTCLMCSHIELFYQKNKFITIITLVSASVNILLNYLLIPKFGYKVAAYTTYIGYAIMLCMHIFNIKRLKLNRFINLKLLIPLFLLNTLVSIGLLIIYDNTVLRYAVLGIIILICITQYKKIEKFISKLKGK